MGTITTTHLRETYQIAINQLDTQNSDVLQLIVRGFVQVNAQKNVDMHNLTQNPVGRSDILAFCVLKWAISPENSTIGPPANTTRVHQISFVPLKSSAMTRDFRLIQSKKCRPHSCFRTQKYTQHLFLWCSPEIFSSDLRTRWWSPNTQIWWILMDLEDFINPRCIHYIITIILTIILKIIIIIFTYIILLYSIIYI